MTQETLAECLGVATETIQNWEAGRRFPEPYNIDRLAAALGVPAARLFTNEPIQPTPEEALEVLRRFVESSPLRADVQQAMREGEAIGKEKLAIQDGQKLADRPNQTQKKRSDA